MKKIFICLWILIMAIGTLVSCKKDPVNDVPVPTHPPNPRIIYDSLVWKNSGSGLMTILIPGLLFEEGSQSYYILYLKPAGTNSWSEISFVPYKDINQTNRTVYYSIVDTSADYWWQGGPVHVYAMQGASIDFNKPASVGIN